MHGFALSAGVLVLLASTWAVGDAARRLASRFWPGEPLVQVAGSLLLGTALIVILLTFLGAAGLLASATMLGLSAVTWASVAIGTRMSSGTLSRVPAARSWPRLPKAEDAVWLAPAAILVLLLVGSLLFSLKQPKPVFDAVAGHMPIAVQWLQAGNIRFMPYVSPVSVQSQYPANGELIDLWLILPVHRDFLIQLAGLPGLAMTIAGVMMAIRELGGRWFSAVGFSLLVPTLPRVFNELIGTNMDDLLLVGSVALMAAFAARHRRLDDAGSLMMAALALGIGAGTRYAALLVLPPLVLLLVVQVWRSRPRLGRLLALVAGSAGIALLAGGYWYFRNLVLTGDPVYPQDIPGHPIKATEKVVFPWIRSYLNLGFHPHDWAKGVEYLVRGYGPIAVLLVIGVLLPPLLAAKRRERELTTWMWSLLPLIGLVCFLATPGAAGFQINGELVPSIQSLSLRYMLPILPYSAILLGLEVSRLRPPIERKVVASVTGVALLAVLFLGVYHPDFRTPFISAKALAVATLVGIGTVGLIRLRPRREILLAGAAIAGLAVAVISPAVASHYDDLRTYAGMPYEDLRQHLAGHSSVAIAGFCETYGLYNPELDRHVEYLTGADDQINRPLDAGYDAWLASLRRHHATAVVLASDVCFFGLHVPQRDWVVEHPDVFRPLYIAGEGAIYQVLGS